MGSGTPKIVFVVMSAVSRPETVDQLARSLAPHQVLVHHDFAQTPHFPLTAPNARFVPEPRRTGWAVFGFTEGVFHSLRHALEHFEFDYLQLLSPTCLPIKSMARFEEHVAGDAQAHFDCIDLMADRDALMSVGYRAFTPEGSLRHRLLRRLSRHYFSATPGRRDEAGIWLRSGTAGGPVPWIARATVGAFARGWFGRNPFGPDLRPYYGSPWFGARRDIVWAMVDQFARPELRDYFSRLRIADEFLVGTLLMQLVERRGPMNHLIQRYEEAHVKDFTPDDLERLRSVPAFFARKFPDDPAAQVRLEVLRDLVRVEPWPVTAQIPQDHAEAGLRSGRKVISVTSTVRGSDNAWSARPATSSGWIRESGS